VVHHPLKEVIHGKVKEKKKEVRSYRVKKQSNKAVKKRGSAAFSNCTSSFFNAKSFQGYPKLAFKKAAGYKTPVIKPQVITLPSGDTESEFSIFFFRSSPCP
jgi:hypothetical protein